MRVLFVVRPFEDRLIDAIVQVLLKLLLKLCTEWLLNGSLADCKSCSSHYFCIYLKRCGFLDKIG